jgi:hypothetical protein
MHLNIDILMFHLSKKYTVNPIKKDGMSPFVGRPRYFDNFDTCIGHAAVLEYTKLPSFPREIHDTIVICVGEPEIPYPKLACNLLIITSNVLKETVFNVLQEIYDLFEEWDLMMKDICYEERGFSELIESCSKVLSDPISLNDSEFSYVTYSQDLSKKRGLVERFVDEYNKIPLDSVSELISTPNYHALEKNTEPFEFTAGEHTLCKNIFDTNQKYVGRLTMDSPSNIDYVSAIFNHLAVYIEKLYDKYGSFHVENNPFGKWHQLLSDGLHRNYIAEDNIHKIVSESGRSLKDEYQLIRFLPNHRYDKALHAQYLCPQLEHLWPGCCCITFDSSIIMLIDMDVYVSKDKRNFYQELAYFLRENLLSASISRSFHDLNQIYAAYLQTEIAMEIGTKRNPMFWYYRFDDYSFYYLLQKMGGDFIPKQICCHGLLILKEHDKKTGSQYYLTLLTYCKMQYNATAAARALYIHRSTFLGRMERIKELTQIDFSNWEDLLYLLISFQLLEEK